LNPIEAEIWLTSASAEPHGRFLGPRCRYASTIEVAYPLQPLPRSVQPADSFTKRVHIAEPSLWTPQTPYLYRADIEQAGGRISFHHGFRLLDIRPDGCRLNGRHYTFTVAEAASSASLAQLREQGMNAVVQSYSADLSESLAIADALGIFVFVRVAAQSLPDAVQLARQKNPSLAGWLLTDEAIRGMDKPSFVDEQHMGVELTSPPTDQLPPWVSFAACSASLADQLSGHKLPPILLSL